MVRSLGTESERLVGGLVCHFLRLVHHCRWLAAITVLSRAAKIDLRPCFTQIVRGVRWWLVLLVAATVVIEHSVVGCVHDQRVAVVVVVV